MTECDYTDKFGTKHAALKANPEKYITAIRDHEWHLTDKLSRQKTVPGADFQVTNLQTSLGVIW